MSQPYLTTENAGDRPPGYATRWIGLIFICLSLFIISMDDTILNVALPSIATDLHASASALQWIVDAYILVFAALLLTTGTLSDRWGRKNALQLGLGMFFIGSVGTGLSTSTPMLIAARAFLGLAGAIIMPSTLSLISASFPPHERPQAFGLWTAVFALGVGIGPVTGGWLIEHFDWNAVFFINLPTMLVALVGGALFLANSRDDHMPRIDLPGVLLTAPGLLTLVYAIIEAGKRSWTDPTVVVAFGLAGVLLGLFGWWERRTPYPMLPLRLFKNPSFTGANLALALVVFSLFGCVFFLTQYLQTVLGYSALEAGLRMLPTALVQTLAAGGGAQFIKRIGNKLTMAAGIFITACAFLIMSQSLAVGSSYFPTILVPSLLFGFGIGMMLTPVTTSIMQSVPTSKAGIGSAMNDTTRQLGGALGIAVLGTLANSAYRDSVTGIKAALPALPADAFHAITSSIQGAHLAAARTPLPSAARAILDTADRAFVNGMNDALLLGAVVMFGAALMTLLILPAQVQRSPEIEAEARQARGEDVLVVAGD